LLVEHIRETLVPMCYVSFSGLIGDTQFANLGVVLFSLLGEIATGEDGVGAPRRLVETDAKGEAGGLRYDLAGSEAGSGREPGSRMAKSLVGKSTRVTGEDQGEVIERVYESGDDGEADAHAFNEKEATFIGADGKKEQILRASRKQGVKTEAGGAAKENAEVVRSRPAATEVKNGPEMKPRKRKRKNAIDDLFSGLI